MANYPAPGGYGQHAMAHELQGVGLDVLRDLDCVKIKQDCTCVPGFTCNSVYHVLDRNDHELFEVLEETSCPMRYFCGFFRAYEIRVLDSHATEVMHLRRPITCGQCYNCYANYLFPCCLSNVEVVGASNNVIGTIRQNHSPCTPSFSGLDAHEREQFHIRGGSCRLPCTDLDFKILSNDNATEVGQITKNWTGIFNECCTNAHRFRVEFPTNADVHTKALILATAIQIDYQHYT